MTIVVSPSVSTQNTSPINRSVDQTVIMAGINPNLAEAAAKVTDSFLQMDSSFPQLVDLLKIGPSGQPTVSGLDENDYPSLVQFDPNFNLNLFEETHKVLFPEGLIQQFDHVQQSCEMGLFPEIGRAWLTIDSDIYLWSYDNATDVAYYDALTETILSVSLVKPKTGIFKPHIKYLLCLTTAVNIHLLGVTFSGDDATDVKGDLLLVPEPIFSVTTDNIVMNCIGSTQDGRIFLGGKDGNIYEIVYQAEEGWFSRKCRKINHSTNALSFLIPSILSSNVNESVIQIEVDNSRRILYFLTDKSTIGVYDLGTDGTSMAKVCLRSLNSIIQSATSVARTVDPNTFKSIVSLNALEDSEAFHIHLVAVSKSGVRFYFTTSSITSPVQRPYGLNLVHVRMPPGFTALSPHTKRPPSSVSMAYCKKNTLILISKQEDKDILWAINNDCFALENELRELCTVRHLNSRIWRMTEEVKAMPNKPYALVVKNNTRVALEPPLIITQHMEEPRKFVFLSSQGVQIGYKSRPVDQLKQLLLQSQSFNNELIRSFFLLYRGEQACAIALILACTCKSAQEKQIAEWAKLAFFHYGGEPTFTTQSMNSVQQQSAFMQTPFAPQHMSTPVSSTNPSLFTGVGSPVMQPGQSQFPSSNLTYAIHQQQQHQMPQMNPYTSSPPNMSNVSAMKFSDKHNAVYLYFSRIVRPFWNLNSVISQLTTTNQGPKEYLTSAISGAEILTYDVKLNDLKNFLKNNVQFSLSENPPAGQQQLYNNVRMMGGRVTNDAHACERNSLFNLLHLINYTIEVLGLWKLLCDHQFHVVASILPIEKQTQLKSLTFRDLIVYGNEMTILLASSLVRRYIEDNSTTDVINRRLQEVCPSIYKQENAFHAKAHEMVSKAKTMTNTAERDTLLKEALELCKQIGTRINLEAICNLFQSAHCYEAIVNLCLMTAEKRDPQNLALNYFRNGEQPDDNQGRIAFTARNICYTYLLDTYDKLLQQSKSLLQPKSTQQTKQDETVVLSPEEAKTKADQMIQLAISTDDELFHIALYNWLYEHQQSDKLLEIQSPYVESYLKRKTSVPSTSVALMDLLYMYYERNGHYRAAAQILSKLAERYQEYVDPNKPPELDLYKRLNYLSRAIVCIKSCDSRSATLVGDGSQATSGEFLHELEEKMEVARIQLQVLEALTQKLQTEATRNAISTLNNNLLDITQLYEDFANRFHLPECQLAILHCAGYYDPALIENLWQSIINEELHTTTMRQPPETQKHVLSNKIKNLGKLYKGSEKYFPLEFIVNYVESNTQNLGFEPSWLLETLVSIGYELPLLLDQYHKLYKSKDHGTFWPRRSQHLLRVLASLISYFVDNPNSVQQAKRRQFSTKCLDVICGYLVELNSFDMTDMSIRSLTHEFRSLKARLERNI